MTFCLFDSWWILSAEVWNRNNSYFKMHNNGNMVVQVLIWGVKPWTCVSLRLVWFLPGSSGTFRNTELTFVRSPSVPGPFRDSSSPFTVIPPHLIFSLPHPSRQFNQVSRLDLKPASLTDLLFLLHLLLTQTPRAISIPGLQILKHLSGSTVWASRRADKVSHQWKIKTQNL